MTLKDTEISRFLYFLVSEKIFLRLLTFVWFTSKKCNEMQLIEINRLNKNSKHWVKPLSLYEKFSNFYGCKLVIGAPFQNPAFFTIVS